MCAANCYDQYADGKAAKVWDLYIGNRKQYQNWFLELLRENNVKTVLDVACGTGFDSIMLLESGFKVISTDASDKMLKYALEKRWRRRKEEPFDKWVIEEANWLTLKEDLEDLPEKPKEGFDAVVCLGNSFPQLLDPQGNLSNQKLAISNFNAMLKPSGILVIDHRNFDKILRTGCCPARSLYYDSDFNMDIKCTNLFENGRLSLVQFDFTIGCSTLVQEKAAGVSKKFWNVSNRIHKFTINCYPHRLEEFNHVVKEIFGHEANHTIYGDFKPLEVVADPDYYVHVLKKI